LAWEATKGPDWLVTRISGEGPGALELKPMRPQIDWRERIVADPEVLVGKPVIKGTRISVELVLDLLGRGYSEADVLAQYDHVTKDDIQACLAYAADVVKIERTIRRPA